MDNKTNKLHTKLTGIIEGLSLIDPTYYQLKDLLLEVATIHNNLRKDGSPEFSHQLEMLALALTIHNLLDDPLSVYKAILVHDAFEDYPYLAVDLLTRYDVMNYGEKLSKIGKDMDNYVDDLVKCKNCSIVKLIDRIHNLRTAAGVFSTDKIVKYVEETEKYYLPMLSLVSHKYSSQRPAYELLKFIMETELNIYKKFKS